VLPIHCFAILNSFIEHTSIQLEQLVLHIIFEKKKCCGILKYFVKISIELSNQKDLNELKKEKEKTEREREREREKEQSEIRTSILKYAISNV